MQQQRLSTGLLLVVRLAPYTPHPHPPNPSPYKVGCCFWMCLTKVTSEQHN